jgi:threonine/homoserine/homoserine lactone efflux protein
MRPSISIGISFATAMGWMLFLIVWLFFYAGDYNVYQNIAVFLVSILVVGGTMSLTWIPWRSLVHDNDQAEC